MRTIEVDDELYEYIAGHTREIGEDASTILRRLLLDRSKGESGTGAGPALAEETDPRAEDLRRYVLSPEVAGSRNVTEKYLLVLSYLHDQNPDTFGRVLTLRGRKRRYFGRSRGEIADSGTSTHPKRVPGTELWALTNSETSQKRDLLSQVLKLLDYPETVQTSLPSRVLR